MTSLSPNPPDKHMPVQPSAAATPVRRAGRHAPSIAWFVAVAVGMFVADLALKSWSFAHVAGRPVVLTRQSAGDHSTIPYHQPIVLAPGLLSLRLTTNTGAVFGLGKGGQAVFVVVSLIATVAICWIFARSDRRARILHIALALILAGALGNLYDRLRFNAVRDMLWMLPDLGLWPWIFNLADVSLVIGVSLVILMMWFADQRQPEPQTNPG